MECDYGVKDEYFAIESRRGWQPLFMVNFNFTTTVSRCVLNCQTLILYTIVTNMKLDVTDPILFCLCIGNSGKVCKLQHFRVQENKQPVLEQI